jgi:hypothetical protein
MRADHMEGARMPRFTQTGPLTRAFVYPELPLAGVVFIRTEDDWTPLGAQ